MQYYVYKCMYMIVFGSWTYPISVCESFGGRRDCLDVGVRVRIVRWSERDCLDVGVGVRIVRWSERDCLDVGVRTPTPTSKQSLSVHRTIRTR
jgi:hypothetical protein